MDGVFLDQFDGDKSWVTDIETPDPEVLPTMFGYNLLVRPIEPDAQVGNIYLPDQFREDVHYLTNIGRVMAMGSQCYIDADAKGKNPHGRYGHKWCEVGDYVVWGRHRGQKIKVRGVSCVILADDEIVMGLEDPKDLSVMYNVGSKRY
jgi:co-chaperonin GroES (HSP10)